MDIILLLEEALNSSDPYNQLRVTLHTLIESGIERDTLINKVNKYRMELLAANRVEDHDLLLIMLDSLAGWCSPKEEL